ncbi:MAG: GHKL domain-containing protein [Rhodospirillales bacterium]|nr:GHKL domain-containing protein [Rhodospirillales bacterium]
MAEGRDIPWFDPTGAIRILDELPDPIVVVDRNRTIVTINRSARESFQVAATGRNLAQAIRHPAILGAVDSVLAGRPGRSVELSLAAPVRRDFILQVAGLPHPAGALLAFHDVTEVRKWERMRADFVANVSHELRSPLASLVGLLETLTGQARDDTEARDRFVAIMHEEARRMARLVDDLLSLSRVEIHEHVQPREPQDVKQIVGGVAELLAKRAAERSMPIDLAIPAGLAPVAGDRDELVQVFQNLIDNAIKYGRAGTPIRIEGRVIERIVGRDKPGIAIAIIDQGEGIPEDDLPRLTERFYRVDKGRSRALGGTGLGLAIVKHIVNRHRGRFAIDSVLGRGSTFTVQLPLAEPQSSAEIIGPGTPVTKL